MSFSVLSIVTSFQYYKKILDRWANPKNMVVNILDFSCIFINQIINNN